MKRPGNDDIENGLYGPPLHALLLSVIQTQQHEVKHTRSLKQQPSTATEPQRQPPDGSGPAAAACWWCTSTA